MPFCQETPQGTVLQVYIQPKSSKNRVVGPYGEAIKIQITAPPVEGEANEALLKFLAKALGLPLSRIELLSGHQGRNKRVLLKGFALKDLPRWLTSGLQ